MAGLPEGLFLFTQNWEADNTQQPSFCSNDFFVRLRLKKMQCMTTEIAVSTASLRLADQ